MKYIKFIIVLLPLIIVACGNQNKNEMTEKSSDKMQVYYCPMHPQVISDKPGVCPICHMDLVLRADDSAEDSDSHDMEGMITLNSRKQVLSNVATLKVEEQNVLKTIKAYSYIDFAEPNRKTITARFNGRIEKLYVDQTGDYIKKGDPLFDIYSPDLIQAQNEFLIALNNTKLNSADAKSNTFIESARKKLEIFGVTKKQTDELEIKGQVNLTLTYYSPFSGTVIEKKVQEGMYVNEGTTIFDIADLSTVWNIAEVYENDIGFIHPNSKVNLRLSAYPTETFSGKVGLIYPVVNQQTRTIKVRTDFANQRNRLRPNMYGESFFEINLGKSILIPADAVLMTGKRNIVWIKTGDKMFEAREVKLGVKIDDKYQVLRGLKTGDEVVSSGGYLIDSESQLKSGSIQSHQHDNRNIMDTKEQETHASKLENEHNEHSIVQMKPKVEKAELIETDESPFNTVCPVLGNKVSKKAPKVFYKGKIITF